MRMSIPIPRYLLIGSVLAALCLTNNESQAFTVVPGGSFSHRRTAMPPVHPTTPSTRFATATRATELHALPDIGSMKVGDMRQELESYGISTRSFLEKKEFLQALEKARAEGKTPVSNGKAQSNGTAGPNGSSSDTSSSSKKSTASSAKSEAEPSRSERIKKFTEEGQAMPVSQLKKKLTDLGISCKSFFEKSEFVKAYAKIMVDGPKNKAGGATQDEPFDPDYRDVQMQRFDGVQQRMLSGTVIDIKLK